MPVQTPNALVNGDSSAKTLADVLFSLGALDAERAKQVKLAEVQSGKSQEEIVKSQNLVNENMLTKAKAELYNIPYIDLDTTPVSPEALSLLPQEVAMRFKAFPVSIDLTTKQIIVAMADPLNLTAIEFIEQKTGLLVKPQAADPSKVDIIIATGYTTSLAKEVSEALHEMGPSDKTITLDVSKTGVIREEKVAEIVSHILSFAVKARLPTFMWNPRKSQPAFATELMEYCRRN